ncbi:MAG: AAA family ATPase, partial [Deltaproteobacteria bacterium]|nr:AAA family ATPase [Deltaproteobacteria bacterium]
GGTGVLLIDEAQNLAEEALENLRLLSNLETTSEKLLQIVLVGQPELEVKLNQASLRQIKQRIAVRSHLDRLKDREVGPFVAHRLSTVGYEGRDLFSAEAIENIAVYSKGIPRLINIICDNALLIAYASSQKKVSAEMIREAARDLGLEPEAPKVEAVRAESPKVEIPKVVAAKVESPKREAPRVEIPKVESPKIEIPKAESLKVEIPKMESPKVESPKAESPKVESPRAESPVAMRAPNNGKEKPLQRVKRERRPRRLARLGIGAFMALLVLSPLAFVVDPFEVKDLLLGLKLNVEELPGKMAKGLKLFEDKFFSSVATMGKVQAPIASDSSIQLRPEAIGQSPVNPDHESLASAKQAEPTSSPSLPERSHPGTVESSSTINSHPPAKVKGVVGGEWKERPVVIQYGSTIGGIAGDVYGSNRLLAMDLLKEANPQIENLNWVLAGQSLSLPPLTRETLLRRQSDSSYRLILASFVSSQGAEKFGEVVRRKGYEVVITRQQVSNNLLLHRVEIGGLKNLEAANQAWETALTNQWLALAESPRRRRTNE